MTEGSHLIFNIFNVQLHSNDSGSRVRKADIPSVQLIESAVASSMASA